MPIEIKPNETEQEFIGRCIGEEVSAGKESSVAAAICYSYYEKDKMSKITDTTSKVMASINYNSRFKGINLLAGEGDDPCWDSHEMIGMKDDGTPNCVPIK